MKLTFRQALSSFVRDADRRWITGVRVTPVTHTRVVAASPVLLVVTVIKSLARGRVVTPAAGVANSVLGTPVFYFRAMRKPSQPFLGHDQSGLPKEAESRSCPTSVHTPDPEPPPPPLLAEPPPALCLVRFANLNFKLLFLPIRRISNSNCLQPSTAIPSQQPAIGQLQM